MNGTSWCRECLAAQGRESGWTSGRRETHLKRRYGITLADYDRMLAAQGGTCAVCNGPPVKSGGPHYHVDHCHETGKIRGLLCGNCNHLLGFAGDSEHRLRALIDYLATSQ